MAEEEKKLKLLVSVPTKNRTDEQIQNSIDNVKSYVETILGKEVELLDSETFKKEYPYGEEGNRRVWYIGEACKVMCKADIFATIDDVWDYIDCEALREVAVIAMINKIVRVPLEFACPDIITAREEKAKLLNAPCDCCNSRTDKGW